jgi:hypothetical protein
MVLDTGESCSEGEKVMKFQDMKKSIYRATGATVGIYAGLISGGVHAGVKVLEGKPEEAGRAFDETGGKVLNTCTEWAVENGDAVIATTATTLSIIGGIKNLADKKNHPAS